MNATVAAGPEGFGLRLAALAPGLDVLGLPACILDRELRYRYANAAYLAQTGWRAQDFIGRSVEQVLPTPPPDDRREKIRRALAGETITYNRRTLDGPHTGQWVRAHYMPLRDDDEAVVGVVIVLVDVQPLKDAQDALAERERHLSLITDSIGFPLTYIDRDEVIRFANRPSREWSDRSPEEMVGRPLREVASADIMTAVEPHVRRALGGEPTSYEREAVWHSGAPRHVRVHVIPDRDAGGEVRGVLIVVIDIEDDHRLREALIDQRKQLQLVLDNIGVPMSYVDRDLRMRFANQQGFDWRVGSLADAIGKRIDEVFDAESLRVIGPEVEKCLAGEKRVYERLARRADGERRWVRVHLVPDLAPDGAVQGLYSLVIDVDHDHRMRETLEQQESQLRFFAENIPGFASVVDAEFRYVFVNRTFERLRGVRLADVAGRHVRVTIGEEAWTQYVEPLVERLKRGETCTYERRIGTSGGEHRWHLLRLAPVMDGEGRFNGYFSVGSDIHDIKLAQERLREQEAQMRLFTDNIPDSVAYLDRNRRILFANRHFASQRGMRPEEVLGKTTREVMGEEVAAWIAQRTQKVLDRGEVATYERLVAMPDGGRHWFHVKAVPHFDPQGAVVGMYVVGHDINEIKEAQDQLAAREEELRFFAENIPEAICYIDLERGCTFVNNVFLATRGISREFALGKHPEDIYGPQLVDALRPHIARVLLGVETTYERLVRLPSGEERWVRVRLSPRHDASGVVRGYYVLSHDIHEIRSAHAAIEDKERQLRQVIDSIPTPVCYVDAGAHYRYVNDAFLEYVGRRAEDVVGRPIRDVLGEERWNVLHPYLKRVEAGESVAVERLVNYADGRARWMNVRLAPRIVDGIYLGHYATTSDIHEQKVVEEELRRAHTILSAHFDNTPLAVIEWDTELRIARWSGQAEKIFGWSAPEALGRSLNGWRLAYEEDVDAVNRMVAGLVAGPATHATLLHRNYRKDGSVIWVEWHNSALRDEGGRVISILSLAQDVSSRIQAEERLQFMATHDGLTGLPNTVLLNDRLEAAIARARRSGGRVGVMFLDLDHFKDVNDTLGHRIGDLLLKELSRRIRAALRQSDVLARISGDEFVVVLEDLPDPDAPERVAEKVLDEVRRPFHVEGNEIRVSGSLGLALHPDDGTDAETLLKNADAAMYHAKELGRNSFRLFSAELAERRAHRLRLEGALRRAMRGNELSLHYQPIVEMETGLVTRAEALLRWNDPEHGLVLPQGFIPLAEETGLGQAIGHWVLEAACRQARAWRDAGHGDIVACVNLSPGQLRDTAMIADLKRILQRTGCEPAWLQFEITETSIVRDVEGASLALAKLRALGVRIAIDDFGTGFSSLSHLRHLPVDVLKIDKAFVADIDTDAPRRGGEAAGGAAIVSAVIGLARGLGLAVVAEGVEKKSQFDFLARQGCHACQGYLLCPPLPAAEFESWLVARRELSQSQAAGPRNNRTPVK
jgi:diguanylate cyclase (GGDEF)-like protein/PAS domain S-box-containing protein